MAEITAGEFQYREKGIQPDSTEDQLRALLRASLRGGMMLRQLGGHRGENGFGFVPSPARN